MSSWSKDELRKISETDDLHISPFREDGVTYGAPTWLWSIVLDDGLYVRAYNGLSSRWYKAAMRRNGGRITAAGMTKEVTFKPVKESTYNADLPVAVVPQLEAELIEQLAQKTFSEQAKGILKQLLAGQRPGIQDLARELHLSTRTLRRGLTEQGITFQRLLDEARCELARHYLLHSSRELN